MLFTDELLSQWLHELSTIASQLALNYLIFLIVEDIRSHVRKCVAFPAEFLKENSSSLHETFFLKLEVDDDKPVGECLRRASTYARTERRTGRKRNASSGP